MVDNNRSSALIICRFFIPYVNSIGGCMRMLTLADFLVKKNFNVYVLSSLGPEYGYFGFENQLKNYSISYVKDPVLSLKSGTLTNNLKDNKLLKRSYFKTFFTNLVKDLLIPDDGVLAIKEYTKAAEMLIASHNIKNIITSGPTHSIHLVGLNLKSKFSKNINWVVDYRDSWNCTNIFRKKNIVSAKCSEYLEKKVLLNTNHYIFASRPMLEKVISKYNIDIRNKSTLVMNGFSQNSVISSNISLNRKHKNKKIKIGYFGSVSDKCEYRDIGFLFHVFDQKSILKKTIDVVFYGNFEYGKSDISLYKNIVVRKNISYNSVWSEMNKMDYLLLFHTDWRDSDEVITGKFFEYVSTGIPIICIGPEDMEAVRLLKEYKLGYHADYRDIDAIIELFEKLTLHMNKRMHFDNTIFSREIQYGKLLHNKVIV